MIQIIHMLDNPPLVLTDEMIIARALKQMWLEHGVTVEMIQEKMNNLREYIKACQAAQKAN